MGQLKDMFTGHMPHSITPYLKSGEISATFDESEMYFSNSEQKGKTKTGTGKYTVEANGAP